MKDKFNLLVCHIVVIFICIFVSSCASIDGFCMTIPQTIFGAFSIASEYIVNHAGNSISGADYVASDINDPFSHSDDYVRAYSDSIGVEFNPSMSINEAMDWLSDNSTISDVDLSSYPSTEAANFILKLSPDGFTFNPQTHVIKKLKMGAIQLFYIAERATQEAVAHTYDKIAVSFDSLSQSDIDNIKESSENLYGYDGVVFTKNIYLKNAYTSYNTFGDFTFNEPVFLYTQKVNGDDLLFLVHSANISGSVDITYYRPSAETYHYNLTSINSTSSNLIGTYGGVNLYASQVYYGNFVYFVCNTPFSSLEEVKAYLDEYGYDGYPMDTPLVNSQFVPYTVPSLRSTIVGIDDIFPAIQAIRDGVISIPSNGVAARAIPDVDDIADIIARAIANGISQVKEDDEPVPDPNPDYTGVAVPGPFPNPTFDPIVKSFGSLFDVVTIFEPIFLVFGALGGLFAFWLVVPFVLLFMAIIRILK